MDYLTQGDMVNKLKSQKVFL